jgi:hypothetical protein
MAASGRSNSGVVMISLKNSWARCSGRKLISDFSIINASTLAELATIDNHDSI